MYLVLGASPSSDRPRAGRRASRRTFLKRLAVGLGLAAVGGAAYRLLFSRGRPAPGHGGFNEEEAACAAAAAEAFFPGAPSVPLSAREVDLVHFLDRYVQMLPDDRGRLFRLLLRTLEWGSLATHASRFSRLPLPARLEVLEGWRKSRLYARRTAYRSLRFACAMGYFEDDRVRRAVGWRLGCNVD